MRKNFVLLMLYMFLATGLIAVSHPDNKSIDNLFVDSVQTERIFTETAPPVAPVRPVAEFEPASHVLIRYPLGIPVSLVVSLSNVVRVICIVSSTNVQNQANNAFQNAGVNMANVTWMVASTNTYWTRDYGPWFGFDGNNQLGIVDFIYNRNRPLDDEIPRTFAGLYNYPLFGMNLIQTGGNYMSDGINTGIQTTLVYDENNSQTQSQVNRRMHDYLGINNFLVMEDPNNTYIDHVDCWGKLLAPDKILIRSVPASNSQYAAIESAVTYFSTHNCAWGYPYRIYRVSTPQNQPYTNSLILNNNVFVPVMNSSYDQAALQVYRTALPGYNVIGVSSSGDNSWYSTDALHCRTHEIPDKNMLYIKHIPLHGETSMQDNYTLTSYIYPYSNANVYADSIYIRYKVNQGLWQNIIMQNTTNQYYSATLTGFAPGDTVRYYIHAADQSGHSLNQPLTAALDPHIFYIAADTTPPIIISSPITTFYSDQLPLTFTASVTDNVSLDGVQFVYKFDDSPERAIEMQASEDNVYYTTFNQDLPQDAQYFYYKIIAVDNANPANVSYSPMNGWYAAIIQTTFNADNQQNPVKSGINFVYPNPFSKSNALNLTLNFYSKKSEPVKFSLFNLKGQLIWEQDLISKTDGSQIINFNLNNLSIPAGIYFIRMKSDSVHDFRKVAILR